MEVRPGYKQTDVGVIPEDWEVARIGDLGAVVRGGSPRPAGDSRYFNGSFIPWLTVAALTNLSENQLRVSETVGFLTEEGAKHSRLLDSGTLIVANSGATLGVAKLLGITCCANDGIAAIINQLAGDKEFVCHYINSKTKHLRDVVATGNGQPNLNTTLIREIRFPFPSANEQRAIATALSDVDALLVKLDQFIAKKRDLKQASMQQLLTGQTRLPGFSGEWEVKRLGDIATCFSGGTPPTDIPAFYGGDIPWITSGDLNKEYITNVEGRISQIGLANSAAQMVEANTLLIALYGATSGVTAISKIRAAINQAVLAIVPRLDDTTFLYFKMRLLKDWLISTYTQGGQPNLSGNIVKSVEFSIPSIREQTAIAAVLSDMDAEIAALEACRDKTRSLKLGMMQELLTGRIRLV